MATPNVRDAYDLLRRAMQQNASATEGRSQPGLIRCAPTAPQKPSHRGPPQADFYGLRLGSELARADIDIVHLLFYVAPGIFNDWSGPSGLSLL